MKYLLNSLILIIGIILYAVSINCKQQSIILADAVDKFSEDISSINDQDDPAYFSYKDAYNNILREEWKLSYQKMKEMMKRYPRTSLRDDAEYWMAYALSHFDKDQAILSYRNFIKHNRGSRYYSDAVADLEEIDGDQIRFVKKIYIDRTIKVIVTNDGLSEQNEVKRIAIDSNEILIGNGPESLTVDKRKIVIRSGGKDYSYSFHYTPDSKSVERVLQFHARKLNKLALQLDITANKKAIAKDVNTNQFNILSAEEFKKDKNSFMALKEIALDIKQPNDIREMAIFRLSGFEKPNVAPIFIDIARNDTAIDIQMVAIDYLCQFEGNKGKSISALSDLFNTLPVERKSQRELIMYKIAEIGNDDAIEFFYKFVTSQKDDELRRNAIYFLGSIGGTKAGSVLSKIMKQE
jgi:hypothetical protein